MSNVTYAAVQLNLIQAFQPLLLFVLWMAWLLQMQHSTLSFIWIACLHYLQAFGQQGTANRDQSILL